MSKILWYDKNQDFSSSFERGITSKFLFLKEAVIFVNEYLNVIKKELVELLDFLKNKDYPSEEIRKSFIKVFSKYDINFKFMEDEKPLSILDPSGIEEMRCCSDKEGFPIIVFFNKNINKGIETPEFKINFLGFIEHELIHRGQYLRIRNIQIYNAQERIKRQKDEKRKLTSIEMGQKYYSDPMELMTFAKQSIEELRFFGYKSKEIVEFLKDISKLKKENIYEQTFLYNIYLFLNDVKYRKAYNQFLKYCFQYLQKN